MAPRMIVLAGSVLLVSAVMPRAPRAESLRPTPERVTTPLSVYRKQIRPPVASLPVPLGFTEEQIALGDRIFHGEAADGQCSKCHGIDAKGTALGGDLTTGMFAWSDGSVTMIKRTLLHNMSVAPRMDGDLKPQDVDAVAAYVWALARPNRP